jgi:hypothetical protein
MQLRVSHHLRLDEQGRRSRIHTGSEPINDHVGDRLINASCVLVMGGECMPISNKEKALILMLELNPIF